MGRNDIHMAPLHTTPRQEAYFRPSNRKTHVLTIDDSMDAVTGIKFFEIENSAIFARGAIGLTPPLLH